MANQIKQNTSSKGTCKVCGHPIEQVAYPHMHDIDGVFVSSLDLVMNGLDRVIRRYIYETKFKS